MANKSVSDETKAKAAQAAAKAAQAAKSGGAKTTKAAPAKKETPAKKEAPAKEDAPAKPEAPAKTEKPAKKETAAKPTASEKGKSVGGLRAGAIVLWVLAIACEVGAFIMLSKMALNSFDVELTDPMVLLFIGFLVVDAILCIVAAQLWKKANRIKPCLSNSAFVRTLWHQLGVIMALVCLIPIGIVFIVKSKEMNKRLRTILIVIMALLVAGATTASVDYQQPSAEEVAQLQQAAEDEVYWTRWGKSYHFDEDCQHIRNSVPENRYEGPLGDIDAEGIIVDMGGESAFENKRFDPCNTCAGGQ